MKLEIGKRYVTRDGRVTSPVRCSGDPEGDYPFAVDSLTEFDPGPELYQANGRWGLGVYEAELRLDLVSEYTETNTK